MSIRLAALILLFLTPAASSEEAEVPFVMPMPEGWRGETIQFPIDFAPELRYEGVEELRFAPGMFEAGSEDFWTYAFVWWVPLATRFDATTLASDLEVYFRGLIGAVSESRGFDPGEPISRASLLRSKEDGSGGTERFRGEVTTFDAFVTRGPVELNVRVEIRRCEPQEHLVVFFELSPQPGSHEVWKNLQRIRDGFRCAG